MFTWSAKFDQVSSPEVHCEPWLFSRMTSFLSCFLMSGGFRIAMAWGRGLRSSTGIYLGWTWWNSRFRVYLGWPTCLAYKCLPGPSCCRWADLPGLMTQWGRLWSWTEMWVHLPVQSGSRSMCTEQKCNLGSQKPGCRKFFQLSELQNWKQRTWSSEMFRQNGNYFLSRIFSIT